MRYALFFICTFSAFLAHSEETFANSEKDIFVLGVNTKKLLLSINNTIHISLDDQVSDGCWTDTKSTLDAVKLEFLRSGYNVKNDQDSFTFSYIIDGLGYELSNSTCAVVVSSYFVSPNLDHVAQKDHKISSFYIRYEINNLNLLTGSKRDMNNRIKEASINIAKSFLVSVRPGSL